MLWLAHSIWKFRGEILLGIQLVAAARRKARDVAREYIRTRVARELKRSILRVLLQIAALSAAYAADLHFQTLASRLAASAVLWGVTLYNAVTLCTSSIPELLEVRRLLRSRTGYAVKYLLQVSLVSELLRWNLVFLALCLVAAWSSRTWLGASFSFVEPWRALLAL